MWSKANLSTILLGGHEWSWCIEQLIYFKLSKSVQFEQYITPFCINFVSHESKFELRIRQIQTSFKSVKE